MAETHTAYAQRPSAEDPSRKVPVDAEDCVLILARLQSGGTSGTIEATKIASGAEDELRIEIHGSQGALRFNLMDPHHLEFYDATAADRPLGGVRGWNRIDTGQRYLPPAAAFPSHKAAIGWTRGHVACLANFLQAVAQGHAAEPGLEQGIRVQQLMEYVRQSASRAAMGEGGPFVACRVGRCSESRHPGHSGDSVRTVPTRPTPTSRPTLHWPVAQPHATNYDVPLWAQSSLWRSLPFSWVSPWLPAWRPALGRQHISEDYFVAGRSLPWYVVAFSVAGLSLRLEMWLGLLGLTYVAGVAAGGWRGAASSA